MDLLDIFDEDGRCPCGLYCDKCVPYGAICLYGGGSFVRPNVVLRSGKRNAHRERGTVQADGNDGRASNVAVRDYAASQLPGKDGGGSRE